MTFGTLPALSSGMLTTETARRIIVAAEAAKVRFALIPETVAKLDAVIAETRDAAPCTCEDCRSFGCDPECVFCGDAS